MYLCVCICVSLQATASRLHRAQLRPITRLSNMNPPLKATEELSLLTSNDTGCRTSAPLIQNRAHVPEDSEQDRGLRRSSSCSSSPTVVDGNTQQLTDCWLAVGCFVPVCPLCPQSRQLGSLRAGGDKDRAQLRSSGCCADKPGSHSS